LTLRGNKRKGTVNDPVPIEKINKKLEKIGVKTVGGFYSACGFEKFVVRGEEGRKTLLEFTFPKESKK
jgi:hypothetical protein